MVNCPLCHASHPVTQSAKGKDYLYCHEAHSTLWLTSPIVRRNLGLAPNNRGYTARENPVYSPDQPRQVVESVGRAEPNEGQWDDAEPNSATSRARVPLRCEECGTPILVQGLGACVSCGEPIVWEE